jgi:hypothetical protein
VEEHLGIDSCDHTPEQMLAIAPRTRDVLRERELDGLVVSQTRAADCAALQGVR